MRNLAILALSLATAIAAQSVPGTLNYLGRLTDNTPQQNPITAAVSMQLAIYHAPARPPTCEQHRQP